MSLERRIQIEFAIARACWHADTFTEIGEGEHDTEYFAVEGLALVGIGRVADSEHAADVEHLDDITGFECFRYVSRETEQRLAMAECAHDDIAFVDLGHAAARQLERVVVGLAREDFHDDHDALFGGQVFGGDAQFVAETTGLSDRGHLVDDDRSHLL